MEMEILFLFCITTGIRDLYHREGNTKCLSIPTFLTTKKLIFRVKLIMYTNKHKKILYVYISPKLEFSLNFRQKGCFYQQKGLFKPHLLVGINHHTGGYFIFYSLQRMHEVLNHISFFFI